MITINFSENIIAGIVSSILTFIFVLLRDRYKYWRLFHKLAGKYRHYDIHGQPLLDGLTEISYLGKNLLKTKGKSSEGEWVGRIMMNEALPEYGSGIYQYVGRDDCGVHQIQVHPSAESIYVLGQNTSHGNNFSFSYLWRRDEKAS